MPVSSALGPSLVTFQAGSLVSPPYAYRERRPPSIATRLWFVPVASRTCLGLLGPEGNVFPLVSGLIVETHCSSNSRGGSKPR